MGTACGKLRPPFVPGALPVLPPRGRLGAMHRIIADVLLASVLFTGAQDPPKRIWEQQMKNASAEELAGHFESAARPVYRYRVAILGLLQLEPGMTAAEIGAGSGFLSRMMAKEVGTTGRVIATELDEKLVRYMTERAKAEGLSNFTAVAGRVDGTGLEPASTDAVAMVNTFSFLDRPEEVLRSAVAALRPGGVLLIVDYPRSGEGDARSGVDAEDVIAAAKAAGLAFDRENGIVPGHFALRFRKAPAR
jgi:predicted methyltransferase